MKNDQERNEQSGDGQGPSGDGMHELLCAYVLGEVTEAERTHVEAELAKSEELRGELANLEATIGLVQGAFGEPAELSEAATNELLERAAVANSDDGAASDADLELVGTDTVSEMPRSYSQPIWTRPIIQMAAAAMVLVFASLAYFVTDDAAIGTARMEASSESAVRDSGSGKKMVNPNADWDEAQKLLVGGEYKNGGLQSARETTRKPSNADQQSNNVDGYEDLTPEVLVEHIDELNADRMNIREVFRSSREPSKQPSPTELKKETGQKRDLHEKWVRTFADLDSESIPETESIELENRDRWESSRSRQVVEKDGIQDFGYPGEEESDELVDSIFVGKTGSESGVSVVDLSGFGAGTGNPAYDPLYPVGPANTDSSFEGNPVVGLRAKTSTSSGSAGAPGPNPPKALLPSSPSRKVKRDRELWEEAADEPEFHSFKLIEFPSFDGGSQDAGNKFASAGAYADHLIAGCRRRPHETPSAMFFRYWGDNAFEYPLADPLSTFSVDVDTASYAIVRNYLQKGTLPPKAAVRTEEFVNYFKADVEAPFEGDFGITTDLAPSLFGGDDQERWMMRVVVRGREVLKQERESLSLTFVVDTSGSMNTGNRLGLVKHALRLLVAELDANDSISIVSFSDEADLILPMTSAANRSDIEVALNALHSNGGTNPESGLQLGYAQASAALREGAGNRVIFLSDGVGNLGQTNQDALTKAVREQRELGIYLNTIGVGMGNHNDTFLEQLANKGDGICNYIDDADEAHRAIVQNFTGAFQTIARDVKIQVEFDPAQVMSYRLLGYENRAIADKDFRNDAVDAGEVGAGHQVTALYELVRNPVGSNQELPLATARVRWKKPHTPNLRVGIDKEADVVTEIAHVVRAGSAAGGYRATSAGYRRAVLVAQFAEFLRISRHASRDSIETLIAESKLLEPELNDADFSEFVKLVTRSEVLIRSTLHRRNDLERAVDALREHCILKAEYEQLKTSDASTPSEEQLDLIAEFERQTEALEEEVRRLVERESLEGQLKPVGYVGEDDLDQLGYSGDR